MRIIMLGTSAAMPNPDRHDSGILISVRDRHYLFDCGHGATNQMVAAGVNPADVNHIFLSHLHYDHIADFAYFHDHDIRMANRQTRQSSSGHRTPNISFMRFSMPTTARSERISRPASSTNRGKAQFSCPDARRARKRSGSDFRRRLRQGFGLLRRTHPDGDFALLRSSYGHG